VSKEISIKKYNKKYEDMLFDLIEQEGEEWKDYWEGENKLKYQKALKSSVSYLLFEGKKLCGYARCRDDAGYGVYIYDLLVDKAYRGNEYGCMLMEHVCKEYQNETVYVLGDVYPYYEKLGYKKEGIIYIVKEK